MTKFHINSKGIPSICKANKGNCPFGGLDSHYDTLEQAQKAADNKNQQQFGLLANQDNLNQYNNYKTSDNPSEKLQSYIEEFTNKQELNINDYQDFYDKVLECDDFDTFASKYAGDVVKHPMFKNAKDVADEAEEMWKSIHYHNSAKDLYKLSDEEAVQVIRDSMQSTHITGWFREYNSGYKPKIENALIINPKLRNASLNIAHRVYQESTGNQVDFDDFLEMDIEVYRGGNYNFINDDVFISYSFDKKIAEKFCTKENPDILTRTIKVKDTLGSLQTTGEAELMVRR